MPRRSVASCCIATSVVCGVLAIASADDGMASNEGCHNADTIPASGNVTEVRRALVCLHNRFRAQHGRARLRERATLRRAATDHARDMIAQHYFDHVAPDGSTAADRIRRSGYAARVATENIAWASGGAATAASVMTSWLSSPPHRAAILDRRLEDIGIGVRLGAPTGAPDAATFTAALASARRR